MIFSKATDERVGQLAEATMVLIGTVTTLANLVIATGVEKGSEPGSEAARLARDYLKSLLRK